jgi:hypothetical protein
MAITACDVGPGTISIGAAGATLTLGPPVGGLESDIALLTPDSLVVPADAVITSLIPYIKGTSIEVAQANMNEYWMFSTTQVAVATTKTVSTVAVTMTTDASVYVIAAGVAMDFGEVTAEKGDYVKCDFTFKGIDADGSGAAATYTDV